MAHLNTLPEQATLVDVLGALPDLAKTMATLSQQIMRGPSELTVPQREFIFAFGSGLNACHFCHGTHTAGAGALGVDEQSIRAAVEDIDSSPVDENFKPLLHYMKKLTLTPSRITRADADAVRAAGWSDNQLHDAITVCGLHNFYNRWVDGCGADADEDFFEKAGQVLAKYGYEMFMPSDLQDMT
jgi:uncharacterized peroxidase-related enzyme